MSLEAALVEWGQDGTTPVLPIASMPTRDTNPPAEPSVPALSELCLCITHPATPNSHFFPPLHLPQQHPRAQGGTGSPPSDKLHLRAGSFSWLVTFQQSNYHCRMRNSLINYYCQAGLCAMIIPSEANFLNIWKQKYYYN